MDQLPPEIAKGGRHRCQPPCHRTSALGSRRTLGPGFGGMLDPRRQGHADFASVVEAGMFPLPRELQFPGPRRPACIPPGAAFKPCWELCSEQSRSFEPLSPLSIPRLPVGLSPPLPPDVSALLSQPFRIRPIGASPNRFPLVPQGVPPSSGPCKSLALLRFPSAPPPPYSYETVTESAAWEARIGAVTLLITWIMGINGAIRGPAAPIPERPVRTRQSRTREPPRSSPAPSRSAPR